MASQFDVNIRTTGDTSGAEKVEQSLERVKAEQASVNSGGAGGGAGATPSADFSEEAAQLQQGEAAAEGIATGIAAGVGAGVILQNIINGVTSRLDEARITAEKESYEFQKQADSWRELAASAKTFADLQKLTESVAQRVNGLYEKARQVGSEGTRDFLTNNLDGLKLYADGIRGLIGLKPLYVTSTQEEQQALIEQADASAAAGKAFEDLAKKNIAFIESTKQLSGADGLDQLQSKLVQLQSDQAKLDTETVKGQQHYKEYQNAINAVSGEIDKLASAQAKAKEEATRLEDEIRKIDFSQLSKPEQLASLKSDLDTIRGQLQHIGIDAATPGEALEKVRGLYDEQSNKVRQLAVEWSKLGVQVGEVNKEVEALNAKRASLQQTIISSSDTEEIKKAASELQKLNSEAGNAPTAQSALEKSLIETITNARSSTAEVERFTEALRQLYSEQAAAPKAPAVTAPKGGDYLLPGENLQPQNPGPSPTAKLDNEQTGAGGNLDQSLNALQQKLDQRTQQIEQITPVIQQIPQEIGASTDAITTGFSDLQSALADGTGKVQSSVQDAAGKIGPLFEPVATSIGTEIPAAISAGTAGVVAAVNAATAAIDADFARQIGNISLRLGAVERGG